MPIRFRRAFLPNPHFIPKLRKFSGRDPRVARYIRSFLKPESFCGASRFADLFDSALYREGRVT